jgi:hypothetical protein
VTENVIPIYDATAPIACTASSDEIAVRIDQLERMRSRLARLDRTEHGVLLHFPNRPDVEAELQRFTVDETGCCTFWGFAIETDGDDLTLRWDGPPTVADLMDRLVAFFEDHEPLAADGGLL